MDTDEPGPDDVSPDRLRMSVDGVEFDARYDLSQPGTYHYTRLTEPAAGYGFTGGTFTRGRTSLREHEDSIRSFLEMVDPVTGYLEDDGGDGDDG